jgi:cellulose synthase/poly-beta-1,6-N-acetylglucosamine synthase-like glycosyltransferase
MKPDSRPDHGAQTAARLLSHGQVALVIAAAAAATAEAAIFGPLALLRTAVALAVAFYVVFVGLKVILWWAAARPAKPGGRAGTGGPAGPLPRADDPDLPRYTVLVPLCREASVIPQLVAALSGLSYPREKLQILLLLEDYDTETREAARAADLPDHFEVLIAPDAGPRTKPKACNFGFEHATGDIVVIYDAEDRPEPDQLLRAVAGFRAAGSGGEARRTGCLQARLAFWNPRGSWVSSFYWAEYVIHFQWVLPGLTRLGLIPPLGGTSNHFLIAALETVAWANGDWEFDVPGSRVTMRGPWDPYNVTEDADLAFRLAQAGYQIGMLSSVTYEEAPETARIAKNQRSRWLQGYAQTGLVHARHPLRQLRAVGPLRYLAFSLLMLGTPASLLLNPVMWAMTIGYVAARLASVTVVSAFIESLFPAPVFYAGILVAVAGNAVLFCQKLITPLRQQEAARAPAGLALVGSGRHPLAQYLREQEYGLTPRLLLTPAWWAFTSVSAGRALRKLLMPSGRSHWDKTTHGHALQTELELAGPASEGFGSVTRGAA